MNDLYEQIIEARDFIKNKIAATPKIAIVLGTGLRSIVEEMEIAQEIPYAQIPHFCQSTVESHEGKLLFGTLGSVPLLVMAGRFHYYEGYTMRQVTFPIRVMKFLGIETLILTNAAGSINENMNAGDIVLIRDHINLHPENPLRGKNDERLGVRFPDMSSAYSKKLIDTFLHISKKHNIKIQTGVYAGLQGPNLETPAEYRYLHTIGADLVGMSTVPEVLVARHSEMDVLAISIVSNKCYPLSVIQETTIADVLGVVSKAQVELHPILKDFLMSNGVE